MPKVVYLDSMLDVAKIGRLIALTLLRRETSSSQVVIAVGTGGEGAVWHLC